MIQATLTSKKSGRIIKKSYTARQLLEDFYGEDDLMVAMTECDCQPVGETYVVECNCYLQWEEWKLELEQQNERILEV